MPLRRRVLIAAGGTGGHFYPGLALALELKKRGWEPLLAVRKTLAAPAAQEQDGIPLLGVDMEGLPRRPSLRVAPLFFKLAKSFRLARRTIEDFHPDAAVGMGGYVSVPCLCAALWQKIPAAVHESNAVIGLANRICRGLGASIFWGLPPLKDAGLVTGTPVREELRLPADAAAARAALGLAPLTATALIFGGSQGAQFLNRLLPGILARLAARSGAKLQVLHLAGKKDSPATEESYRGAPFKAVVRPYLERMNLAYGCADLAICRSGASTLAELCAQRKPALLVPYPHATGAHQKANAQVLEKAGAAALWEESDDASRLERLLDSLLFSSGAAERRNSMAAAYARLALPAPEQAVSLLADAVERLAARSQ